MKKRRLKKSIKIALIILAIFVMAFIFYLFKKPKEKPIDNNPINNNEVINNNNDNNESNNNENKYELDLIDYQVYKDEDKDLGFDFIIARMRIQTEDKIDYDLANLKTDEGIILNNTRKYSTKLENNNYYLSSENVIFDKVIDSGNSFVFKIFIPYERANNTLKLIELSSNKEFEFNLNENNISIKNIKYEPDSKEIEDPNGLYSIKVSDSFVSSMMLIDDEPYTYPSSIRIYTFKLNVNNASSGIYIEKAQFIQDSTSNIYWAMDKEYSSEKYDNIIGKDLSAIDNAALFFEVEDMSSSGMDSLGKLCLKFSSSDEYVEVSTSLR